MPTIDTILSFETFDRLIQLTDVLVWPFLVLILVFFHRDRLLGLLDKINSAKLPGGVEVGFDTAALATEQKARAIEAQDGGPRLDLTDANSRKGLNVKLSRAGLRPLSSDFDPSFYFELLESDRKIALAAVRIDLEAMLNNLFDYYDLADERRRLPLSKKALALKKGNFVTASQYSLYQDIIPLANRAVHGDEPSRSGANSVIAAFETLLDDFAVWTDEHLQD